MNKYTTNREDRYPLENLLGLNSLEEIHHAEFEGFLMAEIFFTERLTTHTVFDLKYIREIHKTALGELYAFAGKYRTVNMSKGGFVFPAARYIPQNMRIFEKEVLKKLPHRYNCKEALTKDIAKVHGELLFIHPFREGNGRTARILANLMARKQGYAGLDFSSIDMQHYIIAVQKVSEMDYSYMERVIAKTF